jgi:hypothetical protein
MGNSCVGDPKTIHINVNSLSKVNLKKQNYGLLRQDSNGKDYETLFEILTEVENFEFLKMNAIGQFYLLTNFTKKFENKVNAVFKELYEREIHPLVDNNSYDTCCLSLIYCQNFIQNFYKKNKNEIKMLTRQFCHSNIRPILYLLNLIPDYKTKKILNIEKKDEKIILKENYIHRTSTSSSECNQSVIRQIDCDVPRTCPENEVSSNPEIVNSLKYCLQKISKHDKVMSYVQGFNYIIFFLLLVTGNNKAATIEIFNTVLERKSNIFGLQFRGILYLINKN